ncbi:hypothetical protein M747DRAFT_367266 [Aspergillus niger ATCC 13496]|uniref:Uncharacterized protein n=1 Tax=Aspergillus niger ATCC 13496 TaxID=1353008 RepID=A0A370CAY9_ASPNG|nr:hypothetical protein M747DRAFT_367266 [Aspergillus niger ATCC 13496]
MDYFESDLVKPPIPYIKGWRFSARSHTTPAPTPVTLDGCRNSDRGREERASLGPVARCCKNPPLPGDLGQQTVELEVLDPIRVGDGHSAQVFQVRVLNPESNTEVFQRTSQLVAKVNVMMVPPGSRRQCNLVFLDFAGSLFGRKLDEPLLAGREFFLGQYISPILRWKRGMKLEFDEWIDWEWADWVDAEFAHTAHTITPAMRERYSKT